MYKAYKYRLYPNKEQEQFILKHIGSCRFIYNYGLNKKITAYQTDKTSISRFQIQADLPILKKQEDTAWLKEVNSLSLQAALACLDNAFTKFFKEKKGFPKFKSKKDNEQSCRFEIGAISKRNVYTNYKLSLANIKNIKFKCSKKYAEYLQKNKLNIKSATLKKLPCGEYYLSILVDGDLTHKVKKSYNTVGIDLGIKYFIITSDGEVFDNLHFKKNKSKKLVRLQNQLSRKQKGSNNRTKARLKLAKAYKKISDKKQYYLHQVSNYLIDENQIICMENLNVRGMLRNHKLANSIQEMNLGEFKRMLEYKAKWYDRKIVFVDRFYPSSKTCNHCGYINKKLKLSDRQWVCPDCGRIIERDYNAALNIRDEGIRLIT